MNPDKEVMKYFPSAVSAEETASLIKKINLHFKQHSFGLFVLEKLLNKEFIGFTGFCDNFFSKLFSSCVEIAGGLYNLHGFYQA